MRRFIVPLVLLATVSCAGSSEVSGDRRVVGRINQLFTARPALVQVGKPVTFTLRLSNTSEREEPLHFSSGKRYDFWVSLDGRTVWRWSHGRAFTQDISTRELGPLESIAFTEDWVPSRPGTYIAHGTSEADGFAGLALEGKVKVGG